ncbi:unnamed protein product [Acanthocheilonema viteae]|uniref:Uncharacterized protein n=1 Tax=Acanthocheilonema viteae TaxID=6277 RepID=A0A498S274_ACAVI|nr:unnamed protein product [Acanthocheilonema viteae]
MNFELSSTKQIGIGLTLFGVTFFTLGIILFLDGALLAIGNRVSIGNRNPADNGILFSKAQGQGIFIIFRRDNCCIIWLAVVGNRCRNLGGFLPVATNFLRQVPIIGSVLCLPGISQILDRLAPENRYPV